MSGVFGCWHLDGHPVSPATVRSCLERISPAGSNDISLWHAGPASLGRKSPAGLGLGAKRPADTDITCVVDGRIDNREELFAALRGHVPLTEDSADCDIVCAAYKQYGDGFIDRIRGDFLCAVMDRRADRLVIARDRLGVRPLCFTRVENTFLFASEAKALLAWPGVRAVPDDAMMADFVLQFLSIDSRRRTFFRDIHSIPPSHLLIVTPDSCTVRRYFEFDARCSIRLPAFRDYVDAFHQLVVAAVRNRLRHARPVAVSVSGGLDSAYIFCVAQNLVRRAETPCPSVLGFNYCGEPGTPSDEDEFIRAIERSCGTEIERVPQRAGFMEFAADEVWQSESPLVEGLSIQRQAMFRRVREIGAGRLLTGHWGDQVLSDSDYLIDLCRSRHWRTVRRHSQGWRVDGRRLALQIRA